ncbi:hypothetical protein ACC693_35655, partial [Rhizobium ruizarguesonis]
MRLNNCLAVDRFSTRKHETPDGNVKNRTREYVRRMGRRVLLRVSQSSGQGFQKVADTDFSKFGTAI